MNARIAILATLLIAQIGLAVYLEASQWHHDEQGQVALLDLAEISQVDTIDIAGDKNQHLTLHKTSGRWTLPEVDGLPADGNRIATLLERLKGFKRGWPVAQTAAAASRFRVEEDDFERRITLKQGEQTLARLYLGTSPGFRKIHARVDGDDRIYAIALSAFEVAPKADDWLDKTLLGLDASTIRTIDLPGIRLVKGDKGLVAADLGENETMEGDAVARLLDRIAHLEVLGLADGAKTKADDKPFELTLELENGKKRRYRFQALDKDPDYRLEVTGRKHAFRIAASTVDMLRGFDRKQLIGKAPATTTQ